MPLEAAPFDAVPEVGDEPPPEPFDEPHAANTRIAAVAAISAVARTVLTFGPMSQAPLATSSAVRLTAAFYVTSLVPRVREHWAIVVGCAGV
jgi:hypothetical protein